MSILYCDCFSGISGDMFLAALIDAGLPQKVLEEQVSSLGLSAYKGIKVQEVRKCALRATTLAWKIEEESQHRHLSDIENIITSSPLAQRIKDISLLVFQLLAQAEAKVHGSSIENVHFHEVGALDSILDIVGAAVGLHYFDIERVYASSLPLGSGVIDTQHGLLPLPAPATVELLRQAQAPLRPSPSNDELVTPTGAAILCALATFKQPEFILKQVGIGAGQREVSLKGCCLATPWANILRVFIGITGEKVETHVELETNIDDMNPQFYQHVMQLLFENGALDVYLTPIIMKKNRPAQRLSVIAKKEDEEKLAHLLLQETSTFGVRVLPLTRHEAEREQITVHTPLGDVSVKVKWLEQRIIQVIPEYDSIEKVAQETSRPLDEVYWLVKEAAQKELCPSALSKQTEETQLK